MKAMLLLLALPVLFGAGTPRAAAFGKTGHQITAALGMHFLSLKANKAVRQALGTTSPEQAGVWMDDMRDLPAYSFMKPWHYVNAPQGQSYKPGGNDLVRTLDSVVKVLKGRAKYSKAQQKQSLLILFHLLGDLHQPLHCGYLADHGGNDIALRFGSAQTNLHSIWDAGIMRDQKISLASCLQLYNAAGNKQTYKAESRLAVSSLRWVADSRAQLPAVYAFSAGTLPADYASRNKELIQRQLLKAGMRLALLLEQIYG